MFPPLSPTFLPVGGRVGMDVHVHTLEVQYNHIISNLYWLTDYLPVRSWLRFTIIGVLCQSQVDIRWRKRRKPTRAVLNDRKACYMLDTKKYSTCFLRIMYSNCKDTLVPYKEQEQEIYVPLIALNILMECNWTADVQTSISWPNVLSHYMRNTAAQYWKRKTRN